MRAVCCGVGSVCSGSGAIPLQWSQHDRFPPSECRQPSGGISVGEVVHGASSGSTETRCRHNGGHNDG